MQTVSCDQSKNSCQIKVPAPGAALVFLSPPAQALASASSATQTFATTAATKLVPTASVDPTALAHSNGDRPDHLLGTSSGAAGTKEGEAGSPGFVRTLMWIVLRSALRCQDC